MYMPLKTQAFRILIASPSDLVEEREAAAVPIMVALPLAVARKLLDQFQTVVPMAESAAGQQQ